jgi:hypothetical protein
MAKKKDISALALEALTVAVRKVKEERKRLGMPLIVWKNGKVVRIPANKIVF